MALKPGFFLEGRAWLDDDGKHIWFAHDCKTKRETSMLPYPTWQAGSDGFVTPSIVCNECGFHSIQPISERPATPTQETKP